MTSSHKELSSEQLRDHLQSTDPKPLIIDVREPWEVQKCSLEGFQHIPMREIPMRWQELDEEQEIVIYCHHGIRSRQVCLYLAQQGFENLINLSDGIDGWAKRVDPAMAIY